MMRYICKITAVACALFLMGTAAKAQGSAMADRIHIGLIGGYHQTSTKFSDLNSRYFPDPSSVGGGALGVFGEFELGRSRMLSLRPQLMFLSRGTQIEDIAYQQDTGNGLLNYTLKAQYTDFRLPIVLNFGSPDGIRPYVYVAPVVGFVRGGEITAEDATTKHSIDVTNANMASTYLAVTPGVGVKIPIGGIDLGLEASYELGLTDTYSSKEKDGEAVASLFFPVYQINGTRKFSGLELAAHISVPLSIFKRKPHEQIMERVVEQPIERVVVRKPCYELEEILDLIVSGQSVEGLTICAIDLINFEYDKSTLTRSSCEYIDKIADLMKRTGIRMEVKGHTDNRGTDEYNLNLSRQRAEAVYNYLLSKGVNANKLSYSYYGKSHPIESNDTEEGRRMNRRVEFEIK